jgi:hypothetical protein
MSTPAGFLNNFHQMCAELATPADAMEILPGLALADAMSSGTVLAGNEGFTTRAPAKRAMPATGVSSRIELGLSYKLTFQASLALAKRSVYPPPYSPDLNPLEQLFAKWDRAPFHRHQQPLPVHTNAVC